MKNVSQFDFEIFCVNQKLLNENLEKILAGHEKRLEIANAEMGEVKLNLVGIRKDVEWLRKFFFIIATSSVGAVVASTVNLFK